MRSVVGGSQILEAMIRSLGFTPSMIGDPWRSLSNVMGYDLYFKMTALSG